MGDISSPVKTPSTVITHIVLFKYRSDISWTDLQAHFDVFLKLKDRCLNREGKPYMLSMRTGESISY